MNAKIWLTIAAILGASAVILGAFGAHGLKDASSKWQVDEEIRQRRLDNWETGARYQIYHALALLGVGLVARSDNRRRLHFSGWAMLLGTIVFSGSLYLYTLTGIKTFGAITPIGGVLLIAGWVLLAVAAISSQDHNKGSKSEATPANP